MGTTAYNRLFNIQVVHNFYVDNVSKKDLAFAPTRSTIIAMKNSNMLFRNEEGGFRVLYKVDDTNAPFINFSNVRLVFALQLLNINEFFNFSDLNDTVNMKNYSAGKILYFTNIGNTGINDLSYSLIDYLRPVTFTYQFPQTAIAPNPSTDFANIIIKDQGNNPVTPVYPPSTGIAPDASNQYHYPIDFTKLPKGLYKFETWTTNSPTHVTETIYIDNDLASQGVFGIVDILAISGADTSFPQPPTYVSRLYNMNFVRRETQWKYIVVLKSPSVTPPPVNPTDISISDESITPFQPPYGQLFFNPAVAGPTVNGLSSVVITSVPSSIPYFEMPKRTLTVKNIGATVITDIPGPPLGVVSADPSNFNITEIFVTI